MRPFDQGGKLWFGTFFFFVPRKPDDIQIILNSEYCQDKPSVFYRETFEFGLIAMNGEEYTTHRKAVNPLFTLKSLRSYVPLLDEVVNIFLVDFDSNLKPETFDVMHDSMDFAFNANLVTFFGAKIDKKLRSEFLQMNKR